MPISGVIFNLNEGPEGDSALAALRKRTELTIGQRVGTRVPAAMDTTTVRKSKALHEWILSQPGLKYVDTVFVNFEGDECEDANSDASSDAEKQISEGSVSAPSNEPDQDQGTIEPH